MGNKKLISTRESINAAFHYLFIKNKIGIKEWILGRKMVELLFFIKD